MARAPSRSELIFGHGAGVNTDRLKEIVESTTFIYCIKLPGFVCHTGGAAFPQYTMIKVGISKNPAQRLYEIMRSFQEFGVSAAETQLEFIREGDSHDTTAEKSKSGKYIIFTQKCHSVKGEIDYESQIRLLLSGDQKLDESFRDQFKGSLDGDRPRSYVDQVGITEWVLAPTALIEQIQQKFRQGWNLKPQLFGCPSGHDFYQELVLQKATSKRQNPAQVNQFLAAHYVRIKFLPSGFNYDQRISPVAT